MWEDIGKLSGLPFYHCASPCSIEPKDELHIAQIRSEKLTHELGNKIRELGVASRSRELHQEQ